MNAEAILKGLNEQQVLAVTTTEGPVMVIAGAGSGKTRVLTHRVAYLIGVKGVPPSRILALTFTNKAAQEMTERITALLGGKPRELWSGTFHAICARILRENHELLGYSRDFVIYDREDQRALLKRILGPGWEGETLRELIRAISLWKVGDREPTGPDARIFHAYQQALKEADAMDFDDLLMKTLELFEQHPEVRERYARRFQYIHVDEYQDTNRIQYHLLRHLASHHRNLFVVGDDDQSIYGFRGADIRNILEFQRDFPDVKIIKLERNYRSTANILKAASAVIAHNRHRIGKTLWTDKPPGRRIVVLGFEGEGEEAQWVAETIKSLGRPFHEIAVLYRTNAQSRAFEERFRWWNIPHVVVGGLRFYERKEIKDLLAYLRAIANPRDDLSLERILNVPPRGIGQRTLALLRRYAEDHALSLREALDHLEEIPDLRKAQQEALQQFRTTLQELEALAAKGNAKEVLDAVLDRTDYLRFLERAYRWEEYEIRRENIEALLGLVEQFTLTMEENSLWDYLAYTSLASEVDDYDPQNRVSLLTIHNAKGLEFPVVFITGLEEGVFPHASAMAQGDDGVEEERRLFHVALTRAKEEVYLTYAQTRFIRRNQRLTPSRFLRELPPDVLEGMPEEVAQTPEPLRPGDQVVSPMFGPGKVIWVQDGKVRVRFRDFGEKTLVLEYARLKRV